MELSRMTLGTDAFRVRPDLARIERVVAPTHRGTPTWAAVAPLPAIGDRGVDVCRGAPARRLPV